MIILRLTFGVIAGVLLLLVSGAYALTLTSPNLGEVSAEGVVGERRRSWRPNWLGENEGMILLSVFLFHLVLFLVYPHWWLTNIGSNSRFWLLNLAFVGF